MTEHELQQEIQRYHHNPINPKGNLTMTNEQTTPVPQTVTSPRFLEIVTEEGDHYFCLWTHIRTLYIIGKSVYVRDDRGEYILSVQNVSNVDNIVQTMQSAAILVAPV